MVSDIKFFVKILAFVTNNYPSIPIINVFMKLYFSNYLVSNNVES